MSNHLKITATREYRSPDLENCILYYPVMMSTFEDAHVVFENINSLLAELDTTNTFVQYATRRIWESLLFENRMLDALMENWHCCYSGLEVDEGALFYTSTWCNPKTGESTINLPCGVQALMDYIQDPLWKTAFWETVCADRTDCNTVYGTPQLLKNSFIWGNIQIDQTATCGIKVSQLGISPQPVIGTYTPEHKAISGLYKLYMLDIKPLPTGDDDATV